MNADHLPVNYEPTPGFSVNPRADFLFKEATRLKKEGDLDSAITALKSAEEAMSQGAVTYSPETRCKLPLYLQQAGRTHEAITKLHKLLESYPQQWGRPLQTDQWGMAYGTTEKSRGVIYDKLRLVLERSKQYREAVPYALLADTYWVRIDCRIYYYQTEQLKGKKPPKSEEHRDYLRWSELQRLKQQYPGESFKPTLKTLSKLLKKLQITEKWSTFEDYANIFVHDFDSQDEDTISKVKQMLDS